MAYDTGAPVLARESLSADVNARHSGPVSIRWSDSTNPQAAQMTSPFTLSLTISIAPHSGHELFGESSVVPVPSLLLSSSVLVDICELVPSNQPESLEGSGSLGGGGV